MADRSDKERLAVLETKVDAHQRMLSEIRDDIQKISQRLTKFMMTALWMALSGLATLLGWLLKKVL